MDCRCVSLLPVLFDSVSKKLVGVVLQHTFQKLRLLRCAGYLCHEHQHTHMLSHMLALKLRAGTNQPNPFSFFLLQAIGRIVHDFQKTI